MMNGNLLFELERFSEAIEAFKTATQSLKNPGQAWLMLGYSAWQANDLKTAKKAFTQATRYRLQKKAAQKVLKSLKNSG